MAGSFLEIMLKRSLNMSTIKWAIRLEILKKRLLPPKDRIPSLNLLGLSNYQLSLKAFQRPERSIWTSIFFPAEILYAFDLTPVCLEGLAAIASGMGMSDLILDESDKLEIAPTLCSYHRGLIGIASKGILEKPLLVASTSNLCDGNLKAFEIVSMITGSPMFFLDVPYHDDVSGISYLTEQINELIFTLERLLGSRLNNDKLKGVIEKSNQARSYMVEVNEKRKHPDAILKGWDALSFIYPTHVMLGSNHAVNFFKTLSSDLNQRETRRTKPIRFLWLHLFPAYRTELMNLVDDGERCRIAFEEINSVYWDELDPDNPLESLARKVISHWGNGSLKRRIDNILSLVKEYRIDGIINFSHWGCRQSSGAVGILQREMEGRNIPFLNLDGDCIDRRSYTQGQFRTRVEGFIERIQGGMGAV